MKRDLGELAAILQEVLELQGKSGFSWALTSDLTFENPPPLYNWHFSLLHQGGLIAPIDTGEFAPQGAIRVTWKGHAFLETYEVWERFQGHFGNTTDERMAYVALISLC